jgi:hypothetical protein
MTKLTQEYTIESLSDYQDIVFDIFNQLKSESNISRTPDLWFRGQSRDLPMLPGVFRKIKNSNSNKECIYNEFKIINTFLSLYKNYTPERFISKSSEFYSFMQHYGIPTRLLDWSENALFALYFAVISGMHNEDTERVVWIMNPGAINQLSTGQNSYSPFVSTVPFVQARMKMVGYIENGKINNHFRKDEPEFIELSDSHLRYPVAFYPESSGNIRIATQKGCFTIHGTDQNPIESFFKTSELKKHLFKIKIKNELVALIREQLQLSGVTARSIYPDIYGLATELCGANYMLSNNKKK